MILALVMMTRLEGLGVQIVRNRFDGEPDALFPKALMLEDNPKLKPDFQLSAAKNHKGHHWAQRIPHGQMTARHARRPRQPRG